ARSRWPKGRLFRRETPSPCSTERWQEVHMAVQLIRELYDYHRWANRRLFDVAIGLGDAATRDMGKQWSVPTVKGMLAHIYGADVGWLSRWKGSSPARLSGDPDFPSLRELRTAWDAFEADQRAFVEGLGEDDLARRFTYKNTAGEQFTLTLGPSLQHVVNHA